jgi:hypothetical protein
VLARPDLRIAESLDRWLPQHGLQKGRTTASSRIDSVTSRALVGDYTNYREVAKMRIALTLAIAVASLVLCIRSGRGSKPERDWATKPVLSG